MLLSWSGSELCHGLQQQLSYRQLNSSSQECRQPCSARCSEPSLPAENFPQASFLACWSSCCQQCLYLNPLQSPTLYSGAGAAVLWEEGNTAAQPMHSTALHFTLLNRGPAGEAAQTGLLRPPSCSKQGEATAAGWLLAKPSFSFPDAVEPLPMSVTPTQQHCSLGTEQQAGRPSFPRECTFMFATGNEVLQG